MEKINNNKNSSARSAAQERRVRQKRNIQHKRCLFIRRKTLEKPNARTPFTRLIRCVIFSCLLLSIWLVWLVHELRR